MKISAYKSKFDDKIFLLSQKKDYIKHLKKIRKELKAERSKKRLNSDFEAWFEKEKETIFTIAELSIWIVNNFPKMIDYHNAMVDKNSFEQTRKINSAVTLDGLEINTIYSPSVSNTHSSPKGLPPNFLCKTDKPRGYPGFKGRISGSFGNEYCYGISELFKAFDIHTGTGGSRGPGFEFEVTIWLSDWPGLSETVLFDTIKKV